MEAARSAGSLKRDGMALVQKALGDPNPEVVRAALESSVILAASQPYAVAELLGNTVTTARPPLRRYVVESLGRIGQDRPAAVIPPLARTLKQGDGPSKALAAATLCTLATKHADSVSPYLRMAAHNPDRDVRAAVAACVATLGNGDPRVAARLASELAGADEPAVRAAVASALGAIAARAGEALVPPLVKLLQDADRTVRVAAVSSLKTFGSAHGAGKHADELEKAAAAVLAQGDVEERRTLVLAAGACRLGGLVRQAASDPDDSVRLEAIRLAATIGPEGIGLLQSAVEDRSSLVRAEAIRLLAATKGDGSRQALPVLRATLRSGDTAARRASVLALGQMTDAGAEASQILGEVLRLRSETLRADAAEALGQIAERVPEPATTLLERALGDPAHDVRSAAIRGLGAVWARTRAPEDLARILEGAETDSARRLVALEALVRAAQGGDKNQRADAALLRVATSGPPLGRLCAQIGRAFLDARPGEMQAFLERLLGG